MNSSDEYEDYSPKQWEKFNVLYTAYITYKWAIFGCHRVIKTNAAKELLELIKIIKFDVIVQDITLSQCFYGLWEVKISDLLSIFSKLYLVHFQVAWN